MTDILDVDVKAADDLPDPEVLASGAENAAYARARRLLTKQGALEEIGDFVPYESLDIRDFFGKRTDATERAQLEAKATAILLKDPHTRAVTVSVSFAAGSLKVIVRGEDNTGPFAFTLVADNLTVAFLQGAA